MPQFGKVLVDSRSNSFWRNLDFACYGTQIASFSRRRLQDIVLNVANWGILWFNANIMANHPQIKYMLEQKIRMMFRRILSYQWLIWSWMREHVMG